MERGYPVFNVPLGFRYELQRGQGKMVVRNEPVASIIQEALEGYASGRFESPAEVKRFLESRPPFPTGRDGQVTFERVRILLTRLAYAGYIERPDLGITLRKGQFDGLISYETYQRIQARLEGRGLAPSRRDTSADFPLRGFIACGHYSTPLTAGWSKGRNRTYPYYLCPKRGCCAYGKSIHREKLEREFEGLLTQLQPSQELFDLATAAFEDEWNAFGARKKDRVRALRSEIADCEKTINQLVDRIALVQSPSAISALDGRISQLQLRKVECEDRIANSHHPLSTFDDALRTALAFLANPRKLWASDRLEDKRAVLKLTFADKLQWFRDEGLRTVNLALPFRVLANFSAGERAMVEGTGFEPV